MKDVVLSPSIMCADLINLESGINKIEELGIENLHIDIIDGSFSPSMPLGIDTVKRMREATNMNFDIHIMSMDNEFFIQEMLNIGVQSITFHQETSLHANRYINLIKEAGAKVGVAINPSTSLSTLDYIIDDIDMVCLMLINPGFAKNKNEKQISFAQQKISGLKEMISKRNLSTSIQVDGRVSIESIPGLVKAGADNLVLGSTSLFIKGNSLEENKKLVLKAIEEGQE